MKVGILTYSSAYNYGALLQAYALRKCINNMGHECEIINYECKGVKDQYAFQMHFSILALKRNLAWILSIKRRKKLDRFRNQLGLSEKFTKKSIKNTNNLYDKFIVGSDQVWNKICTNGDTTYFLDFVEDTNKKNSYAASFGSKKIEKEDFDLYKKLLSDYSHISVRESDSIDLIKALTGQECKCVLDPVFLLEKGEWLKFVKKNKKRFIFVFQLVSDIDTIKYAAKIANEKGYKLIIYSSNIHAIQYGQVIRNAGVNEFLTYIANAELILTDSFHCSAFSIIFNRPFYSKLRKGDNANVRLESLLKMFQLEDRILNTKNKEVMEIDYRAVDEILMIQKKNSLEYLKSIFLPKK